jgi:G3E family GTPase
MTPRPPEDEHETPEFLPWDGKRVPVTLLGGYLGAGKTTVLNAVLASTDQPIAVIVNDIGEVNIDASLVASRTQDTIELTDGCICCSINQGLADAFDGLRAREIRPQHLLIELSGAADPHRVVPWTNSAGFMLDSIVVLVDAEHFLLCCDNPDLRPLLRAQVEAADQLVLSKADLASAATIDATLDQLKVLAPGTPILQASDPTVTSTVLSLGARRDGGVGELAPPTLFDPHTTTLVGFPHSPSIDSLSAFVESLPASVVRAKGIARTADGTLALVHKVGRRVSVTSLPASESQAPTDLVLIELANPIS